MQKQKGWQRLLQGGFALLFLSACSIGVTVHGSYSYLEGTPLTQKDVSAITYHDFFAQSQGGASDSILSVGNVKGLVIPVGFTDYAWDKNSRLQDLDAAFNGKSAETHYWESVSSFYEKSSFSKLHLSFTIASPFETGVSAASFLTKSTDINSSKSAVSSLLASAVNAYKTKTGDSCKDFDADGNGLIDAVYLIYACPDYLVSSDKGLTDLAEREGYWAYTARDSSAHPNVGSPVGRSFTWASYDFLYRGVSERASSEADISVDAHTYIHETGHLLGLDDYYSYTPNQADYTNPNYKYYMPTGGLNMMDLNILDHDAWSKFALGWSKPYVVTSDLSFPLTIELNESQLAGDCLLIPAAGSTYNGTAFDEYLVVELYTPDGLNALDAKTKYASAFKYPQGFFIPGIKISHVDARIAHYQNKSFDYSVDMTTFKDTIKSSTTSSYYRVGASNSPDRSSKDGYRLNHLLEANGTLTFSNLDYATKYQDEYFYANNGTLFEPEDERSTFTMDKFTSFFENHDASTTSSEASSSTPSGVPLFNNGKKFGYEIRVNGIKAVTSDDKTSYKASLTITKA